MLKNRLIQQGFMLYPLFFNVSNVSLGFFNNLYSDNIQRNEIAMCINLLIVDVAGLVHRHKKIKLKDEIEVFSKMGVPSAAADASPLPAAKHNHAEMRRSPSPMERKRRSPSPMERKRRSPSPMEIDQDPVVENGGFCEKCHFQVQV